MCKKLRKGEEERTMGAKTRDKKEAHIPNSTKGGVILTPECWSSTFNTYIYYYFISI